MTSDMNRDDFSEWRPARVFLALLVFCFMPLLALMHSPLTHAEAPQAGDIYLPGSRIEYPGLGLSFILPDSATGMASEQNPDFELFVRVQQPDGSFIRDASLRILAGKADFQTVAAELDREAVIENGMKVTPSGRATRLDNGIAYNEFDIEHEDELKALVMAAFDENGVGLMLFAVTTPEGVTAYKQAMLELARAVNTSRETAQAKPEPSVAPASAAAENHDRQVVGVWMRRSNYRSSGIYIENSNKWAFSADGRVAWGSGAVVAGGTDAVSIRGGGDNPPDYGRWSTAGDILKIQWDDGSEGEWSFSSFEYDGARYLALTARDGSVYRYRKVD
ncbi:MAG TPA: hypothetical protein ENJ79_08160 [Gammaproteobacteria bacterium]|nr:hypothetical protein [Gammaproteobacteria bacterium]